MYKYDMTFCYVGHVIFTNGIDLTQKVCHRSYLLLIQESVPRRWFHMPYRFICRVTPNSHSTHEKIMSDSINNSQYEEK